MKHFIPFAKASADEQIVYGIASTAIVDDQPGIWEGKRYHGDVVDPEGIREALQDYWGNIREMHGEGAAGKALDILVEGGTTYLVAKVVDAGAWEKVKTQVYKGFSIGGRVIKARLERMADGRVIRRILKLLLTEISLVDRPANPEAAILVYKRHSGGTMGDDTEKEEGAIEALSSLVEKAADPTKVVTQIQALRNEAELAGDLEGAERYTQAIGLLLIGSGTADAPEGEAAEEDEAAGDEIAMAEDATDAEADELAADEDEEEIAMGAGAVKMSARAQVRKAGRKIAGSRMKIMKDAVMAYLKVLEEAGDEDSAAMLKAISKPEGGLMDTEAIKAMFGELQKAVNAPIETIAKAVLKLNTDLETLKAQPQAGGPVGRFVGQQVQPIAKSMGGQPPARVAQQADPQVIAKLKRMIALESHPALIAQYTEQLKALTGD